MLWTEKNMLDLLRTNKKDMCNHLIGAKIESLKLNRTLWVKTVQCDLLKKIRSLCVRTYWVCTTCWYLGGQCGKGRMPHSFPCVVLGKDGHGSILSFLHRIDTFLKWRHGTYTLLVLRNITFPRNIAPVFLLYDPKDEMGAKISSLECTSYTTFIDV